MQHVQSDFARVPARGVCREFPFPTPEVYIRRDPGTGDVMLSQSPGDWDQIFASLDHAGFPDDFLEVRDQDAPQVRDTL
jgi:antitoxin VapB